VKHGGDTCTGLYGGTVVHNQRNDSTKYNEKMKKINLILIFFILIGNSLLSQESDYYKILDELLPKIESKLIKKSNDSFFKSTDDVLTRLEFNRYMHVDTAIKQSDWNQIVVPDEQYITEQLKNPNYKWRR
jgi:hypothetical protein